MTTSKFFQAAFAACGLLFLAIAARGEAPPVAPDGGQSIFAADWMDGFALNGSQLGMATLQRIDVSGQPFKTAFQIETKGIAPNAWSIQLTSRVGAVTKGDTLYATFFVRCERAMAGGGYTQFVFEKASPDWEKSIVFPVSARNEWTQFYIPFTADADYAANAAQINFRLGYSDQIVQIADLRVVNYGKVVAVKDLPTTKATYPGRALDAPWRAEAEKRIEQYRKANLAIHVQDAAGKPVAGASVTIAQQHQAFGFGSCVNADAFAKNDPALQPYRDIVAKQFSQIVFENDLKWDAVNAHSEKEVLPALDWLDAHHVIARGHNLVWPSYQFLPKSVKAIANDPKKLKDVVDQHITSTAARYKGRLIDWDVINEPFNNHDLMDILGKPIMVEWFQRAHAADPGAKLYLNDWGLTEGGGHDAAHQDSDFETLKYLIDQHAPIDGLGLQSHFDMSLTAPPRVYEILDRYAGLGLRLKITELDISVPDPQLQADYLRDYMTICFSHPSVDGIIMWGFWQDRHWLPQAALYNSDWSPRPAAKVFEDLVLNKWRTNETLKTDANGNVSTRGFLGDYEISVGGARLTAPLTTAGARIVLKAAQ